MGVSVDCGGDGVVRYIGRGLSALKVKLYFLSPDNEEDQPPGDVVVSTSSSRLTSSYSDDTPPNLIVFPGNDPELSSAEDDQDSLSDTDTDDDDEAGWSRA